MADQNTFGSGFLPGDQFQPQKGGGWDPNQNTGINGGVFGPWGNAGAILAQNPAGNATGTQGTAPGTSTTQQQQGQNFGPGYNYGSGNNNPNQASSYTRDANGTMQQTFVDNNATGYNGVTGAKATYNPSSGMWVDTNGQQIRPDAISMQAPGSPAGPPTNASGDPNLGAAPAGNLSDTGNLAGSGQQGALIQQLMGRANQSLNINPLTDPIIRPQVDAFAAQQTRQARGLIDQAAESGNPYATGAVQNARTQAAEQAGQNTAQMQSQLAQNELTARRQEIEQALQESGSLLTAQQQMSLQQELGLLDTALKQQQLNLGADQFTAQLGLQSSNQNNYWDALRSGLISR